MENTIKRIQNGETHLLNEFVKNNMDFIYSFTKKYYGIFEDYEDLVQEAILVFINSVYDYDFNSDFYKRFSCFRIHNTLKKYILNNLNRINDIESKYYICYREYENCRIYLNHEPSPVELSRYLGIKNKIGYEIINFINNTDVINFEKIYLKDEFSFEENSHEKIDREIFIENILSKNLTDKQRMFALLYYGFINNRRYQKSFISRLNKTSPQSVETVQYYTLKKLKKVDKETIEKYIY